MHWGPSMMSVGPVGWHEIGALCFVDAVHYALII